MSIRLPSHLYRNRHGTFYFRFVIPQDLRDYVKSREVRFSLGTECRATAIMAAIPIVSALPNVTERLRRMADEKIELPPQYLKALAEQTRHINRLIERNEELEAELDQARMKLAKSVSRESAQRQIKGAHTLGQLNGRQKIETAFGFGRPPEETPLFSKLKDSYLSALTNNRAEGGSKKPPTAGTLEDYDRSISLFAKVMGDPHIGAIDENMVGKYFGILKRLPAHMNGAKEYRGKEIAEILAMTPPPPPQTEATCSKKIERISTMFKWAIDPKRRRTWGIDVNPFTGFGQSGNTEATRRAFTNDELRALLNHPHFKQRSFTANYMYWLIPLALYSGARLGELTLLDLKDFVVEEGIPSPASSSSKTLKAAMV